MSVMHLVLLTLVALNAVVLAIILRLGRGRDRACGACGCLVRDLDELACPHCDADLREAGILTRRMSRLAPVWLLGLLAAAILTTMMPAAIFWTLPWLDRVNPLQTRTSTTITMWQGFSASEPWQTLLLGEERAAGLAGSTRGGPPGFEVRLDIREHGAGGERCTMILRLDGVQQGSPTTLDLRDAAVWLPARAGVQSPQATADDLQAWLASTGLGNDTEAQRDALADMAAQILDNLTVRATGVTHYRGSAPLGSISIASSIESYRVRPWAPWVYAASWVLAWLAGLCLIALRARRRHRAIAAAGASIATSH